MNNIISLKPINFYNSNQFMPEYSSNILSPSLLAKKWGVKNFVARSARKIAPPHFQSRGAAPDQVLSNHHHVHKT